MCYNMDSLAFPRRRQQAPAPRGNMCSNNMCSNLHAIHMIYYCVRASIQRKAKTDVCQKCAWNTPWFTQHTVIHGTHRDSQATPCALHVQIVFMLFVLLCVVICVGICISFHLYITPHTSHHTHTYTNTHTLSLSLCPVYVWVWCDVCGVIYNMTGHTHTHTHTQTAACTPATTRWREKGYFRNSHSPSP